MRKRLAFLLLGLVSAVQAEQPQPICHYHEATSLPISFAGGKITTEGLIDGTPVSLMLDTGSTYTLLTRSEVQKLGLRLSRTNARSFGVSGESTVSLAEVPDISIGVAHGKDILITVVDDTSAPFSAGGVVGTDFLFRADIDLSLAEGKLKFFTAKDCETAFLPRWDGEISQVPMGRGPGEDNRPRITVELNGVKVDALIDSGASMTVVDLRTAARLGITPDSPGVVPGRTASGVGTHPLNSWIAPFASVSIGGETIKNLKLTVADLWGAARRDRNDTRSFEMSEAMPHMLLGADFLQAHHVLFAVSQQQFYFSYLGGKVFHTE